MIKYFTKIAEQSKKPGGQIDYMAIRFLVWNSIPTFIVCSAIMAFFTGVPIVVAVLIVLFVVMPFYFFLIYTECKNW